MVTGGQFIRLARSRRKKSSVHLRTFGLLAVILSLSLLKIFYTTPLRGRIEDKLYDIRLRLAPHFKSVGDVVVLGLDDKTLETHNRDYSELPGRRSILDPRTQIKSLSTYNANYSDLAAIAKILQKTAVKHVAMILPSQIYNYDDPEIRQLTEVVKNDGRFSLGIFDVSQKSGDALGIPNELKVVRNQIFKADLTRDYRRGIVREAVVDQRGEIPYITRILAEQQNTRVKDIIDEKLASLPASQETFKIRPFYVHPKRIPQISMSDWLQMGDSEPGKVHVNGKIVIVGYTAFRPATVKVSEATFVNTPWQEEGHDVVGGVPLVTVLAMISQSLAEGHWIEKGGVGLSILQTLVISLLSFRIWGGSWGLFHWGRFTIGFASFLFIGGWSCLMVFHGFLFTLFGLYVPLADTALASVLITTGSALRRLSHEGRLQAALEAKTEADREVALVQDRFLNTFAEQLALINLKVRLSLENIQKKQTRYQSEDMSYRSKIFSKAVESCEELDDYLNGIRHFSYLEASAGGGLLTPRKIRKISRPIDLNELVTRILGQFEARMREKKLQLLWAPVSESFAPTDGPLASQILYNLISNAIKYSPEGGKIWISLRQEPRGWRISVQDEGPGIDPLLHGKIFEKFYRIKNDLVYRVKGHGLGLYLSNYFAKLIDARIEVDSVLGKGSTFHLLLPRRSRSFLSAGG